MVLSPEVQLKEGNHIVDVTDDLLAINAEVCRELWRMVDTQEGTVGALTPKLVLPPRNNQEVRISEQEARFIYASVLTRAGRYFFSVETPTKGKYSFTNDADASPRSALSDLALWTFDRGFKMRANIEFKAGNPPVDHISKDIEKLLGEGTTQRVAGNWFHLLKNVDGKTLPRLFAKFQEAFIKTAGIVACAADMQPIVFCFCVLEKKWAILKVFAPHGDLAVYCRQFFDIGYAVRRGKISVEDSRGWLEVLP